MASHPHWWATWCATQRQPFPTSWRGHRMATPVGWAQGGSGSVCLAFDQLRDVIESQEELIHQLRNVVCSRGSWGRGRTGSLKGRVGARPCPEPRRAQNTLPIASSEGGGTPKCYGCWGLSQRGQGLMNILQGNSNQNQNCSLLSLPGCVGPGR